MYEEINTFITCFILLPIVIIIYLSPSNCTALHHTALHYTALHYTTPHYTTLHYTKLHYTTLHYTKPCHTGITGRDEYEKVSRDIRYGFYTQVLSSTGCAGVIFGHHLGDVQENVISNVMRLGRASIQTGSVPLLV